MLYEQIEGNKRKTILVVAMYLLLFIAVGAAVGYFVLDNPITGIVLSVAGGFVYTGMMLINSTEVVMRLNHATEITQKDQAPMLWNIVEDMAMVAQVPIPRVFIIEDSSPNAFATGSNPEKAAVAVTTGLLERLNREELEGVIAHEFAHIRNFDIRLQTIAVALGMFIAIMVQIGSRFMFRGGSRSNSKSRSSGGGSLGVVLIVVAIVAMLFGSFMSTLLRLALSRNREYLADATAVEFTRNPQGLISALEKISEAPPMSEADQQSASLYIANPFKKDSEETDSLFATHPATSNRIKRLREM